MYSDTFKYIALIVISVVIVVLAKSNGVVLPSSYQSINLYFSVPTIISASPLVCVLGLVIFSPELTSICAGGVT